METHAERAQRRVTVYAPSIETKEAWTKGMAKRGHRTLSDLAVKAIEAYVDGTTTGGAAQADLEEMTHKMNAVLQQMNKMGEELKTLREVNNTIQERLDLALTDPRVKMQSKDRSQVILTHLRAARHGRTGKPMTLRTTELLDRIGGDPKNKARLLDLEADLRDLEVAGEIKQTTRGWMSVR